MSFRNSRSPVPSIPERNPFPNIPQETSEKSLSLQRSPSFMNFSSKIDSLSRWLHEVCSLWHDEGLLEAHEATKKS